MKSMTDIAAANGNHENWISLIEVSAREVFELMLSSRLIVQESSPDLSSLGMTSMVGLAGQLCGLLSVRCDRKAAALMTSKMLGVPLDQVGPEVSDALGEICNMVAGNFKNKIAGLGDGCLLSPPTVITGTDYDLHSLAESPGLEVRLLFEGLPVVIALQVNS
jgi:chemotaxis protein CheX